MIESVNKSIEVVENSSAEERIEKEIEDRVELACWAHYFCPSQDCIQYTV